MGRVASALAYLVLGLFSVLTLYPVVWLVLSSFKSTQAFQLDRLGLPRRWLVDNYVHAWRIGQFDVLMANSFLYTAVTTVAVIVLSVAAGFAFAKLKSRATPFLYGGFVIGILLTIQSIMVPLFLVASRVHLYNTRAAVLIVYTALGLPLGVYLCTEYMRSLPDAIIESARIDGASYFTILWRIVLPTVRPVVTSLAILTIPGVWNEFMLINILVSDNALKSLPVGILRFSGALSSDYGKQFAGLVIGLLPMVVFYLALRRHLTQGVMAGAVKG